MRPTVKDDGTMQFGKRHCTMWVSVRSPKFYPQSKTVARSWRYNSRGTIQLPRQQVSHCIALALFVIDVCDPLQSVQQHRQRAGTKKRLATIITMWDNVHWAVVHEDCIEVAEYVSCLECGTY